MSSIDHTAGSGWGQYLQLNAGRDGLQRLRSRLIGCSFAGLLLLATGMAVAQDDDSLDFLFGDAPNSQDSEPDSDAAQRQQESPPGNEEQPESETSESAPPASDPAGEPPLRSMAVGEDEALPTPPAPKPVKGIEEIIVTATRRDASTRDLAGSVNAITGADLEAIAAQGLEDYLKLVPGVSFNKAQADRSVVVIRGIATSILPGFTQLTAGVFADDLPLSDAIFPQSVPDLNPFDLERVEVLKGPQGTLFGAGALSGAVRYITNKPVLSEWQVKAQLSGTYQQQSEGISPLGAVALNLPIGDSAALRAAGLFRVDNGRVDEIAHGRPDTDELEQLSWRVLGRWQPTARLDGEFMLLNQVSDQRDFPFTDQSERFERSTTPFLSPRRSRFSGANLSLSYAFDRLTLLSSSNLVRKANFIQTEASRAVGEGTGGTPNPDGGEGGTDGMGAEDSGLSPLVETSNDTNGDSYAQEFRLTSQSDGAWDWLLGAAFLLNQQFVVQQAKAIAAVDEFIGVVFDPLAPLLPLPTPLGPLSGSRNFQFLFAAFDSRATEIAVFGDATYHLGARWEFSAGARVFRTALKSDNLFAGPQATILFNETEHRDLQRVEEQGINPKVSARFLFNENLQVFALASRGFQFGGTQLNPPNPAFINAADATGGAGFDTYDSSSLWNYELGVRSDWFDSRLQLDSTFFLLDWKDLQLTEPVTAAGIGLFSQVSNVGRAKVSGVELALQAVLWGDLSFSSNASIIRAVTVSEFTNAGGMPITPGTRLPGTPKFQISNVLSYQLPGWRRWNPVLGLSHSHIGTSFNDLEGSAEAGGYDTFDARIGLSRFSDWRPSLTLNVVNLTDERGIAGVAANNATRNKDFYLIPPRTLILTLSMDF